jgi:rootletin
MLNNKFKYRERQILQSFNEYYSVNHQRLLTLWRAVVAFRRQFTAMKSAAERDVGQMRADVTRSARGIHSSCINFSTNVHNLETEHMVSIDREKLERAGIEKQLKDKIRQAQDLQSQLDSQTSDLNARLRELTSQNERLKQQLADKEHSITQLQLNVSGLQGRVSREAQSSQPRDNLDLLYEALRRITEEALNDSNRASLGTSVRTMTSP